MKITIESTPQEMADLVLQLQGQSVNAEVVKASIQAALQQAVQDDGTEKWCTRCKKPSSQCVCCVDDHCDGRCDSCEKTCEHRCLGPTSVGPRSMP